MKRTRQLAILFADIAGSTRLYETLGNDKALLVTSRTLDLVARIVCEHDGTVIKTIGDEAMCVFPTSDQAARTAITIQDQMTSFSPLPGLVMQMRIGFHFGEVIEEGGDVFGDAVNMAARMTSQAKAEQIITTAQTLELLSPDLRNSGRELNKAHIHGKSQPIRVCELTWGEVSELTVAGTLSSMGPYLAGSRPGSLTLTFQGRKLTVNQDNPLATMGRGERNNLVSQDPMASRHHARVEWRLGGDFYLVDQSTNGTFVIGEDGTRRFLQRDEMQLKGSGLIGPGREPIANSPQNIHFSEQR
jgi:adenylate cyclase